jgi:hypothetical protein
MQELKGRFRNLFKPANAWDVAYHEGYRKGFEEGQDIGERVAHNRTLAAELPRILSAYSQLQVKIMMKPKKYIQEELEKFEHEEMAKLKMDLQR